MVVNGGSGYGELGHHRREGSRDLFAAAPKVGAKLDEQGDKAGVVIDDATITTKVKAAAEPGLKPPEARSEVASARSCHRWPLSGGNPGHFMADRYQLPVLLDHA